MNRPRGKGHVERFIVRRVSDNMWLCSLSLKLVNGKTKFSADFTHSALQAVSFDLQMASHVASVLDYAGHACQVSVLVQ